MPSFQEAGRAQEATTLQIADVQETVPPKQTTLPRLCLPRLKQAHLPFHVSTTLLSAATCALVWAIAAGGFITYAIGAARTINDFQALQRAAQLSEGSLHLFRAYSAVRWAAFGSSLAPLVLFPIFLSLAGLTGWFFADGGSRPLITKRKVSFLRAALILLAALCALATVAAVLAIAANVKAADKMSEVGTRVNGGTDLLNSVSTTVRTLQRSGSSNPVGGLINSVIGVLSGNGQSGTGSNALAQLAGSSNITSLYNMISSMPVGTVVGALDSSPQGILQLAALLSAKTGGGSLTCAVGCLNQQDACICNINQLGVLSAVQTNVQNHIRLALIGSCILAAAQGLLLVTTAHRAASMKFQQKLVFGSKYDMHLARKHAARAGSHSRSSSMASGSLHLHPKAQRNYSVPIQVDAVEP